MQTVWGDGAVSDAHVHFFSRNFFSVLTAQKPGLTVESAFDRLDWRMPPGDPVELAGEWVEEFDRHGVARAALISSIPGDESSVDRAVAAFPDRFRGYFMVNPLAEGALDRAVAALGTGRMRGICFFPAMHRYYMTHERAQALVEAAAHAGAVVFVHCGALSVGVRKKLGLPSPFDMRYSNPMDLHGTALAYPRLPIVIPHFGAGFLRETLMLADLCPNIYLDTSSSNRWMLYEGLELNGVFRRALDVLGPSRLLFGTDSSYFPRGWQAGIFERQAGVLAGLGLDSDGAKAIFSGNFDRLFS